jgi:hypothetical protein
MTTYEVRLLQEHEADTPVEAVRMFIQAVVDEGFKGFMYRVVDLDSDENELNMILVQDYQSMTLQQAVDKYGLDLDLETDEDDEDDDDDSVISNVNE